MNGTLLAVGIVLGAAWGGIVSARLHGRAHRYADETEEYFPVRRLAPLVVPGSALLTGVTLGGLPALGWPAVTLTLAVLVVAVPLCFVDLDVRRLPDRWLLPSIPALLAVSAGVAASTGQWARLGRIAWLVPLSLLTLGLLWLAGGGSGLGLGDVKLAALLAVPLAWVSATAAWTALVTSFLLGGIVAVGLMLAGRADRKTPIPFGPFLVIGTVAGVLLG